MNNKDDIDPVPLEPLGGRRLTDAEFAAEDEWVKRVRYDFSPEHKDRVCLFLESLADRGDPRSEPDDIKLVAMYRKERPLVAMADNPE